MLRTVHVRTVFPTGGDGSTVATYSESGRGDDPRSFFFVLSHPTHAERLARLLPAYFKRPAGWRNAEALVSQVNAAVIEVERTSGHPVDLALVLVDAPRLVTLTRGEGVVVADTDEGRGSTRRLRGERRLLPTREDAAGSIGWSADPRPGDRFLLGLAGDLDRLVPQELADLATLVGRRSRLDPATRAAGALAARGGALVVGRVNHVPWAIAETPAARAVAAPVPGAPPAWRRRLASALALALAVAAFAGLAGVERPREAPRTPARAHAADEPTGPELGAWVFTPRSPIVQRPLAVRGLLFAPRADGEVDVVDRETGLAVRTLHGVGPLSAEPLLVGGAIVVPGEEGALEALDPGGGSVLWRVDLPAPASALVADRGRLWAASGAEVICVDAASGALSWRRALGTEPIAGLDVARGVGALVTSDGEVTAFNPVTGAPRWSRELGEAPLGGPTITKGHVYVALARGTLVSLHVYRGQERWRRDLDAPLGGPVVMDADHLYAATADGAVVTVSVDGTFGWRAPLESDAPGRLILDGSHLLAIAPDGRVEVLHRATGERVGRRRFSDRPHGKPLLVGGRLIALTTGGHLEALDWRGPDAHARLR